MTTATRKNKAKIPSRKVLSNKPAASIPTMSKNGKKAAGLIALWNAPSPGLFQNVAEVDAHIREVRGDWDDED